MGGLLPSDMPILHKAFFAIARTCLPDPVLEHLALAETRQPRESLIYRLSRDKNLSQFKTMVLISSPEDQRFPHFSTSVPDLIDSECKRVESWRTSHWLWLLFLVLTLLW